MQGLKAFQREWSISLTSFVQSEQLPYVNRYIRFLKDRVLKKQCSQEEVQGLDVSDLTEAECAIIRDAQIEAFEEEIVVLRKQRPKQWSFCPKKKD